MKIRLSEMFVSLILIGIKAFTQNLDNKLLKFRDFIKKKSLSECFLSFQFFSSWSCYRNKLNI